MLKMLILIITESKGDIGYGRSFVMIQSIMLSVDNEHAYSIYTLLGLVGHENEVIRDIRTKQYTRVDY
jgi:hypothetical protein